MFINVTLGFASIFATAFLWREPIYLITLLLIFGSLMVYVEDKRTVLIYIIGFILGPLVEIIVINIGGAWNYSEPHALGIPLWLPFLWGNASLFINNINSFTKK